MYQQTSQHYSSHCKSQSQTSSFFFNDTATTEIYTLSLHDALPICPWRAPQTSRARFRRTHSAASTPRTDRKSTRLNSSHSQISYAVFCLKKKKWIDSKFYPPGRSRSRCRESVYRDSCRKHHDRLNS